MTDDYRTLTEDGVTIEVHAEVQDLIESGMAWRLEGHVGRTCMAAIENGDAVLGDTSHRDYWGNYVPSRHEVEPGTKGSVEYAHDHQS